MATRILLVQLATALGLAAFGLALTEATARALLLGGIICLAPNAYFAYRVFGRPRGDSPQRQAGDMLRAEVAKLVMSAALFGVVFASVANLNVPALLGAYVLVHLSGSIAAMSWTPGTG